MINGEQSYTLWSEKVGNLEIIFSESIGFFFQGYLTSVKKIMQEMRIKYTLRGETKP